MRTTGRSSSILFVVAALSAPTAGVAGIGTASPNHTPRLPAALFRTPTDYRAQIPANPSTEAASDGRSPTNGSDSAPGRSGSVIDSTESSPLAEGMFVRSANDTPPSQVGSARLETPLSPQATRLSTGPRPGATPDRASGKQSTPPSSATAPWRGGTPLFLARVSKNPSTVVYDPATERLYVSGGTYQILILDPVVSPRSGASTSPARRGR